MGPWSIVGANWRLDNAKSTAATLQENNPDGTCMMSTPSICLASCCTCDVIYVSLEACDDRAVVSRMTNRHGHWVCWMSMGGKTVLNPHTSSSVEHLVEVIARRRLFLVTSVTPIFHTKIVRIV